MDHSKISPEVFQETTLIRLEQLEGFFESLDKLNEMQSEILLDLYRQVANPDETKMKSLQDHLSHIHGELVKLKRERPRD